MKLSVRKFIIEWGLFLVFISLLVNINFNTARTDFYLFIGQFFACFALLIFAMNQQISWQRILIIGLIARIALLWGTPELSNDFYRFIWDGELLLKGINPYAHVPDDLISHGSFMSQTYFRTLYHGMGELSASNYSCYPIINQFCFMIGAVFSDNITTNVLILKLLIIMADIGSLVFGIKILKHLKLPIHKIGWYFINPFIILEFTGNLHFEGVMICFILMTVYLILKMRWFTAAIWLGIAVHVKLIPLLFIPFFYKKLQFKKALGFTALTLMIVLLLGQILLSGDNLPHFLASVQLYFKNFQFNASIFYWINALYSNHIGWDTTKIVGPILAKLAFVFIILMGVFKAYRKPNDFIIAMLFALVIYYAFATTVHPWYISLILILSIFTPYKFGILWSGLIALSYLAYSDPNFTENHLLNSIAYLMVYGYMGYEIVKYWSKDSIGIQIKSFFGIENNQTKV